MHHTTCIVFLSVASMILFPSPTLAAWAFRGVSPRPWHYWLRPWYFRACIAMWVPSTAVLLWLTPGSRGVTLLMLAGGWAALWLLHCLSFWLRLCMERHWRRRGKPAV